MHFKKKEPCWTTFPLLYNFPAAVLFSAFFNTFYNGNLLAPTRPAWLRIVSYCRFYGRRKGWKIHKFHLIILRVRTVELCYTLEPSLHCMHNQYTIHHKKALAFQLFIHMQCNSSTHASKLTTAELSIS